MTRPVPSQIEILQIEVAQLSQTLQERRLELDTLKLKASGEWLEAGERIVCRVSGCVLECVGPRVNEHSVFGFDAVVVETTTLVEDQGYGLYQVGSRWPLGLADVQKMVAKHQGSSYSHGKQRHTL